MSSLIIAKNPNLTFLYTQRKIGSENDSPLPLIIKNDGKFDWEANSYISELGGGSMTYNIKPTARTVVKKAYSLNLFCSYIENQKINLKNITNKTIYDFINCIKKDRDVNDDTILSHGRVALGYIVFLSKRNPNWNLATENHDPQKHFKVHYEVKKNNHSKANGKTYLHHAAFLGLIHISAEAEYIRDYELEMWLDAINETSYHPEPSEFLVSRWLAFTTLLEVTGSRISEIHQITRSSIVDASKQLFSEERLPRIKSIPVNKGKYAGKTRSVEVKSEDLQVILWYINLLGERFPDIKHDAIFVDSLTGDALSSSYLKNYAKKVINQSKYAELLKHLNNHSFRHRFITLFIAKELKKLSSTETFTNMLSVAQNVCRKITLHASNSTLSTYIHLACEINNKSDAVWYDIATSLRLKIKKLKKIKDSNLSGKMANEQALSQLFEVIESLHIHLNTNPR